MGFDAILVNTLQNEGGEVTDVGGHTNYGITQDTFNSVAPNLGLQPKNVKDLKYGEVRKIYEEEYFKKPKISELPSEKLQGLVFDHAVNAGAGTAIKSLQEIVGAKPDGKIGKKTLEAVKNYVDTYGEEILANEILNSRGNSYINLINKNPEKYGMYERGWVNRINNLKNQYKVS